MKRLLLFPDLSILIPVFIIAHLGFTVIQLILAHAFFLTIEVPVYIFCLIITALFYWLGSSIDKKRGGYVKRFFATIFIAILITLPLAHLYKPVLNRITEKNAMEISTALEKYYADKGSYPKKLKDLDPDYLDGVPRNMLMLIPRSFKYSCRGDTCTLEYSSYNGYICNYSFELKKWGCYD